MGTERGVRRGHHPQRDQPIILGTMQGTVKTEKKENEAVKTNKIFCRIEIAAYIEFDSVQYCI